MKQISRRICSVLLVLSMLLTLCGTAFAGQPEFPDTVGHWAEDTINALAKDGVISGFDDGLCHPDDLVSSEQFIALVVRYFAYPLDRVDTLWPDAYLAAAEKAGLIDRVADGTGQITRVEMVRIMLRALNRAKNTVTANTAFEDDAEIMSADKADINKAVELDILHGYPNGTMRAYSYATRAEAFVMLRRMMDVHEDDVRKAAEEKKKQDVYVPAPTPTPQPIERTISFVLPRAAHTDTSIPVEVSTVNADDAEVSWKLQRDNVEIPVADVVNGTLDATGGIVRFKEAGNYTLTASFFKEKEYHCTQTIQVYPVVSVSLYLPEVVHTDETVKLGLHTENLDGLTITWTMTKDGVEVDPDTVVLGEFSDGEELNFSQAGTYFVTATVVDALDRTYAATEYITVYPVGAIGFFMPTVFHTDDTVLVEASIAELAGNPLSWSLTKDGAPVPLADHIKGVLTEHGGNIQVAQKGNYVLTASFTDAAGRVYSYEQAFKVYPVPTVEFGIPKTAWTDTEIPITVESMEIGELEIEWLVDNTYGYQDWDTFVDGKMDNNGGTIRFKRTGQYEVVARVTDVTGRVFLYELEAKCAVQPVLDIQFNLPERIAVGQEVDVRTSGNNNVLPVEWTVEKDGTPVPFAGNMSGTLNSQGGKVSFPVHGTYTLIASMTDVQGRTFSHGETMEVYPIPVYRITAPASWHIGDPFQVSASGEYLDGCTVTWAMNKDGVATAYSGALGMSGGEVTLSECGIYDITATVTDRDGNEVAAKSRIEVTNTAPAMPTVSAYVDYTDGINTYTPECGVKVRVNVTRGIDPDGDSVHCEYDNGSAETGYYGLGNYTVKVRSVDQWGSCSPWVTKRFTVACDTPTVQLTSTTLGDGFVTESENVTFDAAVMTTTPYKLTAMDYYFPQGADSVVDVPAGVHTTINGHEYHEGRHLVVAQVKDWFGNAAYASQFFIVGSSQGGSSTEITSLSTTVQENGIYDGEVPLAYISSFSVKIPTISGHNTGCQDSFTIYGLTADGTTETLLNFHTNDGYVYADSEGNYEFTAGLNEAPTKATWTGWNDAKYTKIIFEYVMPSGHDSCIQNASQGLSYSVAYNFIEGSEDNLENLFE